MNIARSRLRCGTIISWLGIGFAAGACFISAISLGAQQSSASAAQFVSKGWSEFEQGRPEAAKPLLEKAVRLSPANADYQAALAEVESKLGQEAEAVEHFKKAILLSPSDAEFRYGLAQILQKENKDREALHVLQVAHPGAELLDQWHFSRGFSLFRTGRFDEATREFQQVIDKAGFKASASFFLGNIAYSQGDLNQAAQFLANAVELGDVPENQAYNAYTYDYGLVLMKLGKCADAIGQFKASIERYENDPLPWMFLGRCQAQEGNYSDAIESLETSIRKDPKFQLSYYELARLQQKHGDPQRAAEVFRQIASMKEDEIKAEEDRAMKFRTGARSHE